MTNKLKYFVGNWKMFGDFRSISILNRLHNFCNKFSKQGKRYKVIFCVPNSLIYFFKKNFKSNFVYIGAQNCHHHYDSNGPFTGSESAGMIKKIGAEYIILGHSENRATGDSNKIIKNKIKNAMEHKLNIIFCIGENLRQKKSNKTYSVLKKQIKESVQKKFNPRNFLFAYEPVWSIGTGNVPKPIDLIKIFRFIRNELKKSFGSKKKFTVLYGGSVSDKNIGAFSSIQEIDGFLIGGASRSSKKFIDIMKKYYK